MVVKALYTNIPNNEGIAAVKLKQDNYTKKTVATKVIKTFLARILTLSNSMFDSKFLPSNQRLCYGNNMHPHIRKHIHARVQREIHLLSH